MRTAPGRGPWTPVSLLAIACLILAGSPAEAQRRRSGGPALDKPATTADPVPDEDPISTRNKRRAMKHWNSGLIWFQKGRYDRAREEWLLCRAIDPSNTDCPIGLKRVDRMSGLQTPVSIPPSRKPAKGAPDVPKSSPPSGTSAPKVHRTAAKRTAYKHWNNGIIYFQKGDDDKAKEEWTQCLIADPSNADCMSGLKRLGGTPPPPPKSPSKPAKAKKPKKAATPKLRSEENRRKGMKHWNYGIIYFQKGDYAKARDEWLLCLSFDPSNRDCSTGIGRLDSTFDKSP